MKYFKYALNHFEQFMGFVFLVTLVVVLVINVVTRYVIKMPMSWTEEIAVISFILLVFTGASCAVTTRQHLRVTFIHGLVKKEIALALNIFANVAFLVAISFMAVGMYDIVMDLVRLNVKYVMTGLPKTFVYGIIFGSFVLLNIRLIQDSIRLLIEYKRDKESNNDNNVKGGDF